MTGRPLGIDLLYVHSTALGYARYGVKLAEGLHRAGVKVKDDLHPDTADPHHVVCWISTPTHAQGWFEGQRPIISTMWESGTLPEAFREGMDNFAQVIVPSEQNLELFSRYHPNVVKVPLGVDSQEWRFRARRRPEREFVFLIGGSGARKGTDLAYKAFKRVFGGWKGPGPVPKLIFKSPRPIDFWGPNIEHVGGRISDEAEQELYAMAHCYLQPSRGEGWGLQPLQAIAQGCPTILTDAHGHAEFAEFGYGIGWSRSKADYFIYGDAGQWWEPDLDELCERMEWVYSNYDEAAEFAARSSEAVHARFNWDTVARQFAEAVGLEYLGRPYAGSRRWVKPTLRRYLVRVVKPWRAEIAGTHYQFQPGRDYYELADVKRILFEQGGVLDPSCIVVDPHGELTEAETGLAQQQLDRMGDYSASMSYCWTCHQKLGSGVLYEPPDEVPA